MSYLLVENAKTKLSNSDESLVGCWIPCGLLFAGFAGLVSLCVNDNGKINNSCENIEKCWPKFQDSALPLTWMISNTKDLIHV